MVLRRYGTGNTVSIERSKVIASTNPSLQIKAEQAGENAWYNQLPQIPESFVEEYVEANGEITEVLVEYDSIPADRAPEGWDTFCRRPRKTGWCRMGR